MIKCQSSFRQNKGGTFHLSVCGHEMIGAAAAKSLIPGKDWGFPTIEIGHLPFGLSCELEYLFGAFLARDVPHHSGGRMMPEHYCITRA
jgi:TPP-dependent pyruvate/acetoin dehydrogenase alpha subunit